MSLLWGDREWRRVVVYGLGLSGRAATALLRRHGVEVLAFDARSELPKLEELDADPGVELRLGSDPTELPMAVDGVVMSPGVPPNRALPEEARRRGIPVIGEVELGFSLLEGTVIAVTGSNGKSTTTALVGALLVASGFAVEVCGNIGEPLCDRVEGPPGRIFVVELSSFQLEGIVDFRARAAALLNLSPDHLDRHPEMSLYLAAKRRIFECQQVSDIAILNADDHRLAEVNTVSRRRTFSRLGRVEDGCWLEGDKVLEVSPSKAPAELFAVSDLSLVGPHNLENAMAACLLARAAGAGREQFAGALQEFHGLPHRMERVADHRGVLWLDDSKGTNLDATARSLEGCPDGGVHLILGGRSKGADPAELVGLIARKARRVYLVGESAAEFAAALNDAAPWETAGTLDRAVDSAAARARPGEVVLLSPACSSFDQYQNFSERGDHFQTLVHALGDLGNGGEHG
jgi:UDP-N-acetylmuramoylalanine--D-glutamate ligase